MMHYTILFLLFPFLLSLQLVGQTPPAALRVMSYNIRYDTETDGIDQWKNRKGRVAGLIRYHQPDLLGVQEALPHQLRELEKDLPQYAWYGVGRDDGKEKGEFSAIFYNKERFQLLDSGTFWLSPSPDKPTKGWDAAIIRICSWVKLKDLQADRSFYHFNTHFDHIGEKARENSALLLQEKIKTIAGTAPVVLTGDFNTAKETKAYHNLTQSEFLKDARQLSGTGHYGPSGSWSTFDVDHGLGQQIDFIFVTQGLQVQQHAILTDSENGKYPSDHLPVMAVLSLSEGQQ